MIYLIRNAILASALITLPGCTDSTEANDLQTRVEALETETKALRDLLNESKESIEDLEVDKWLRDSYEVAFLKPSDQGYSLIKTNLGALTVQLSDVRTYANGSRVTLKFGNLGAATIDGVKAKIEWGRVNEKGIIVRESEKSRQISFDKSLRSGAWTSTSIILDGIPPSQLGFVRISEVKHEGIRLVVK
jgi:hypothetical protein